MTIKALHQLFLECDSISTDTRKITSNCMFFALKGENFNGNKFAKEAIRNGAKYAIVDEINYVESDNYILVEDCLLTLQELAKYHRIFLNIPIIALTGSNGKTTTKELINAVLNQKYNTISTLGNLNNHIGVPITLLSMNPDTEIGIVEMGANHLKEIEFLCNIAKPDYGYITNFGKAHLEGFGSEEGVLKGKSELYDHLKQNNKLIFFNSKDEKQIKQLKGYKNCYSYGDTNDVNTTIKFIEANPLVSLYYNDIEIRSNLIGKYNFNNICAAITIGQYFKVNASDIKNAIEGYVPENNRSQIINKNSKKIVLDAYNANPTSMKAALESFDLLKDKNKVVILGDMFELGQKDIEEHQDIVDFLSTLNIDKVFIVGALFYKTKTIKNNIERFKLFEELKTRISNISFENYTILIKGSRGMALERILEFI